MPTVAPCCASAAARFVLTVDLPTPPLPAATAMMFFTPGRRGLSGRFGRPRTRAENRTSTPVTPETWPTAATTAAAIASLDGQAGVVSSTPMTARPPTTSTPATIPRGDEVDLQRRIENPRQRGLNVIYGCNARSLPKSGGFG